MKELSNQIRELRIPRWNAGTLSRPVGQPIGQMGSPTLDEGLEETEIGPLISRVGGFVSWRSLTLSPFRNRRTWVHDKVIQDHSSKPAASVSLSRLIQLLQEDD